MTLYYPDISAYQRGIDLSGALAVCAKATEGVGYSSPVYSAHKAQAAGHGAVFVAYHFLHAGDPGGQAAYCHGAVGSVPLMLDVEQTGDSQPQLADITGFVDAYRQAGGVIYLVYLPHWYWQDHMGGPSLHPLIARRLVLVSSAYTDYTDSDSGTGWQQYGGMTPVIWQYTDSLAFGGEAGVDFNAFRGSHPGDQSETAVRKTIAEFRSLVTTGRITPSGPPDAAAPAPPGDWRDATMTGHGTDGNLWQTTFDAASGTWTTPQQKS